MNPVKLQNGGLLKPTENRMMGFLDPHIIVKAVLLRIRKDSIVFSRTRLCLIRLTAQNRRYTKTGSAFFHECPPLSVSVLTLKKSKSDPRKP